VNSGTVSCIEQGRGRQEQRTLVPAAGVAIVIRCIKTSGHDEDMTVTLAGPSTLQRQAGQMRRALDRDDLCVCDVMRASSLG